MDEPDYKAFVDELFRNVAALDKRVDLERKKFSILSDVADISKPDEIDCQSLLNMYKTTAGYLLILETIPRGTIERAEEYQHVKLALSALEEAILSHMVGN